VYSSTENQCKSLELVTIYETKIYFIHLNSCRGDYKFLAVAKMQVRGLLSQTNTIKSS